jgi:hypothetical protein
MSSYSQCTGCSSPIVCCCSLNKPTACPECLQSEFDPNPANIDPDREREVVADFNRIKSFCAAKIADFNQIRPLDLQDLKTSAKRRDFQFFG